ncbi:MAG: C39 family peptidase [Verrucomicrobiota bacterium]
MLPVPYVNQVTAQQKPHMVWYNGKLIPFWDWCGLASTAMVAGYYGKTGDPTGLARTLYANEMAVPTYWGQMSDALKRRGIDNEWLSIPQGKGLPFSTIVAEIDAGRPVIFGTQILPNVQGHISVIVGYDLNGQTLIVHDPYGAYGWFFGPGYSPSNNPKINDIGKNNGVTQRYPYSTLKQYIGNMMIMKTNIQSTSPVTITVNDEDTNGSFQRFGPAQYWYRNGNGQNGGSWWTRNSAYWVGPTWDDYAAWAPKIPATANYTIEVFIPDFASARKVWYEVYSCGDQRNNVAVDQLANRGKWLTLGTFCMPAGQATPGAHMGGNITLTDVDDGQPNLKTVVVWDTMRLTKK